MQTFDEKNLKNMEKSVNERVKFLREKLMLSQRAFSEKIGISSTAISKIEDGGGITGKVAKKICEAYKVNPEWLLYGRGEIFLEENPKKEKESTETLRERLAEFKGYLKGLLAQQNLENLWEKIEPNFPKCKGVRQAW